MGSRAKEEKWGDGKQKLVGRAKARKKGMRQAVREHKSPDQTAAICRRQGKAKLPALHSLFYQRGLTSYITLWLWPKPPHAYINTNSDHFGTEKVLTLAPSTHAFNISCMISCVNGSRGRYSR